MLRQGPIPAFLHAVVEYAGGGFLIAAPFLFGFDADGATAMAIIVGIALVVSAAIARSALSLSPLVPLPFHVLFDFVVAGFLVASPFLFGFSDERAPTALFIAGGVLLGLLTIATRFLPAERQA